MVSLRSVYYIKVGAAVYPRNRSSANLSRPRLPALPGGDKPPPLLFDAKCQNRRPRLQHLSEIHNRKTLNPEHRTSQPLYGIYLDTFPPVL